MAQTQVLTLDSVTDTTATILVTDDTSTGPAIEGATVTLNTGATAESDSEGIATFTSLMANTTYTATSGIAGTVTFTTKATGYDDPKTATQEQWEDLTTRIKAKANTSDVPTITMTTTDPGEGSALAENHFVAIYGGDPIIMDYSTSEVNTGAKWVNGSAIYKKTINAGALPNASTKTIAHGISDLDMVIDIRGAFQGGLDMYGFACNSPSVGADNAAAIRTSVHGANIEILTGTDRTNLSGYVTLYYTKVS